MKTTNAKSVTQEGSEVNAEAAGLSRRKFIRASTAAGAAGLFCARGSGVLEAETPPPSEDLFFETPATAQRRATQWLFVGGTFTWSQAVRLPLSEAITDDWGPGWLLAPIIYTEDFTNAALVTKKAMGDLRGELGPFIGVVQAQGAEEPREGFFNLDGSVPRVTWGKHDPNDGARINRNALRTQKFQDALKNVANEVIDYFSGNGTADRFKPTIDFIVDEVARPEGGRAKEDVVALWHEKNGSITAGDVNAQTFCPALLSRRKPLAPQLPGKLPSWPTVDTVGLKVDLKDGMKVGRRSKLSWRWTQGAKLGAIQVIDHASGRKAFDRPKSSSAALDLTILRPGTYLLRIRNITKFDDPWLEIGFVVVP